MSRKSLTIIYVPGLGGRYDEFRRRSLARWQRRGRQVVFVPMKWTHRTESVDAKLGRILDAIDAANHDDIVLVGESAGAAIALVAQNLRPHVGLVTLCGKIGGARTTSPEYFARVPSFADVLPRADYIRERLTDAQRRRIVTVRALVDTSIPQRETTLPGVRQCIVPLVGHLLVILAALTVLRPIVLRAADRVRRV